MHYIASFSQKTINSFSTTEQQHPSQTPIQYGVDIPSHTPSYVTYAPRDGDPRSIWLRHWLLTGRKTVHRWSRLFSCCLVKQSSSSVVLAALPRGSH